MAGCLFSNHRQVESRAPFRPWDLSSFQTCAPDQTIVLLLMQISVRRGYMDNMLPEFPFTFRVRGNEITIRQFENHKHEFPVYCNGMRLGTLFYREEPYDQFPWGYQTLNGKVFPHSARDLRGTFDRLYDRMKGRNDEGMNPLRWIRGCAVPFYRLSIGSLSICLDSP